jgi:hypothetical protein
MQQMGLVLMLTWMQMRGAMGGWAWVPQQAWAHQLA